MSSLSGVKCWGEPLPPQEFLRKFALPQVVRVLEGNKVHGPSKMDLDRPLLLHKAYICQQVHARSIDRDKNGGITYVGPPLILPDTYPGWFAVITDEGHTAGYFGSVSEVASAQVPYFLSREQAQAYREDTDPKGNLKYSKVKIKPGEVLQFLGAYEDTTYTSKHSRPLRYAKVVDRQGELLFLPFPTPGKFFSVAGRRTRSVSHVFRLSQLLSVANLPITVRLVSGPKGPRCPFTGLLRLEWFEERHVILACALRGLAGGEPTLLEIDVSSEFRFLRPMDDQKVRLSKAFAKMLRHCGEKGEAWRQQIKIAHHVIPNVAKRTACHESQGGAASSGDSYEDEDSGVRSSTVKSLSSSKSSASSRLFKRLRLLHQSWKNGHRATTTSSRGEASGSEDSGLPKDALSRQYSDFHLYERVRGPLGRNSWGNSSDSTEILDDDGYVTSDFGGEESSTYDSVCRPDSL